MTPAQRLVPDIESTRFAETTWPSGDALTRVGYEGRDGHRPYAPKRAARFSPIVNSATGATVPTLYAAATLRGALSESVFHDLPVGKLKGRVVNYRDLHGRTRAALAVTRSLRLADLTSIGLVTIDRKRSQIIEPGPCNYTRTGTYAQAVYDDPRMFDGLLWVSRHDDTSKALMVFGDRVIADDDLTLALGEPQVPLTAPAVYDEITMMAAQMRVEIIGSPYGP